MEKFESLKPGELLALTGQIHADDYKYDKIFALYCGMKNDLTPDDFEGSSVSASCIALAGMNLAEKRIVDIAVHPYYRRLGLGKMLVNLLEKEFGVELAYTVDEEAEKFWRRTGWMYVGKTIDKGTEVKMWMPQEAVDADMLSGLPEALRRQFEVQEDEE